MTQPKAIIWVIAVKNSSPLCHCERVARGNLERKIVSSLFEHSAGATTWSPLCFAMGKKKQLTGLASCF